LDASSISGLWDTLGFKEEQSIFEFFLDLPSSVVLVLGGFFLGSVGTSVAGDSDKK
jgi:hypothetical protein